MFARLHHPSKRVLWLLRLAAFVVVVALVAGGAAAWNTYWKQDFFPKRLVQVDEGLWRSGQISQSLVRDVLESRGIGLVVDLSHPKAADPDQLAEQEAVRELNIEHLRLPLNGSGDGDIRHYADALEALARAEREGTPALVHCRAGSRRAAGIVASYQVLVQGVPPEEAYLELDRYGARPVAESPLLPYLNQHMSELATLLVERKVIDAAPDPIPRFVPPSN